MGKGVKKSRVATAGSDSISDKVKTYDVSLSVGKKKKYEKWKFR